MPNLLSLKLNSANEQNYNTLLMLECSRPMDFNFEISTLKFHPTFE